MKPKTSQNEIVNKYTQNIDKLLKWFSIIQNGGLVKNNIKFLSSLPLMLLMTIKMDKNEHKNLKLKKKDNNFFKIYFVIPHHP